MHSVHKLLSGLIIKSCAVWSAYQTRLRAFGCVSRGATPTRLPRSGSAQTLLHVSSLVFVFLPLLLICLFAARTEGDGERVWASLDNDAAVTDSIIQPPGLSISLSGVRLPVCHPCSATPTSHIQSQGTNESEVQLCRKSKRATGDAPEAPDTKTHWIAWRKSAYVRT